MTEDLYADPEGIRNRSKPYAVAAQDWENLKTYVNGIRTRYHGAWGDDDLGNKFGPNFAEGMESIELGVGNLGETLLYYSEGLVESGQIYGDARDDADEATRAWLLETDQLGHEAPKWATQQQPLVEAQQPVLQRAVRAQGVLLQPGEVTEGQVFRRSVNPNEQTEGEPARPAFRMRALALRAEPGEPLQPLQPMMASRRLALAEEQPALQPMFASRKLAIRGEEPLEPLEPLQPAMTTELRLPGEPIQPLEPLQPAIPRASTAIPPPGQVWSDGHWLYSNGNQPILLNNLESPYQHGAEATPYQPGTIPQPARGELPPSGEFWSDGVYVYSSDHGVLAIDQLDSPYDFT